MAVNKDTDLLVRVELAHRMAEKALDMAMDALIKVQAMKESTHKVSYVDPFGPSVSSVNQPTAPEESAYEPSPEPLPKLSPFSAFKGIEKRMQTVKKMNDEIEKGLSEEQVMKSALWDDAMTSEEEQ